MNKRMSNNKYVIMLLCYCVFKNMILCQKRNMLLCSCVPSVASEQSSSDYVFKKLLCLKKMIICI